MLSIAGGVVAGLVGGIFLLKGKKFIDLDKDKKTAEELIERSEKEGNQIKEETIRYVEKRKENFTQAMENKKNRLKTLEESLIYKEEVINKREERNKEKETKIKEKSEEIKKLEISTKNKEVETIEKLITKTEQDKKSLKTEILQQYKEELEEGNNENLAKIEENLKEDSEKIARSHTVGVIQRLCSPTSVESRTVSVKVEKDHIKGKIVGEKGKNIKAFEEMLDVDIIFNDEPNTITISSFMLVNRRIAQLAMEKLIKERGDIDRIKIEKAMKEAQTETDKELYEIGKKHLKAIGIKADNNEFCRLVGRLQYRTSYGQNIMKHSMEVGWIANILAYELGLNVEIARVAGFLHDLGKAIDQDPSIDKPHDELTKELMTKYNFPPEAIHAAWAHHDAEKQKTPEALIVKAADAISAGRPGARQESFEKYLERITALQATAEKYEGVKKAFTVSAGREVRAIVDPDIIDDEGIKKVAKILAQTIESKLTYPGQIKVNVIRRTKHTETAR